MKCISIYGERLRSPDVQEDEQEPAMCSCSKESWAALGRTLPADQER